MSFYLPSDRTASFIVDAAISYTQGQDYYALPGLGNESSPYHMLEVVAKVADNGLELVAANVTVNTTGNEIRFEVAELAPRSVPYEIELEASSMQGQRTYLASTQLSVLPDRTDGGSVVKLDSLYGGLHVRHKNASTTYTSAYTPLLPYSFYVSWDGWLNTDVGWVDSFKAAGYNIIHIVPNGGLPNKAFNYTQLGEFLDRCDELGLWIMYDMRWTYQNSSSLAEQVTLVKDRPRMLLWYTADEPDGQGDPLNATTIAYDSIKSIDPYHPVSLCLNCYNFNFADYSAGADIVLSDVYPISNNVTYSEVYDTVCNTTYGCCGCDDCKGNFEDISARLDAFAEYEDWLGRAPKPAWAVPQAFGNESFWHRYLTPDEEVLMTMLSVNHGAKGVVMWIYPSVPPLNNVTSQLAGVLTQADIARYVLGSNPIPLQVQGESKVDAAGWTSNGKMLMSVCHLDYEDSAAPVTIELPKWAVGVDKT